MRRLSLHHQRFRSSAAWGTWWPPPAGMMHAAKQARQDESVHSGDGCRWHGVVDAAMPVTGRLPSDGLTAVGVEPVQGRGIHGQVDGAARSGTGLWVDPGGPQALTGADQGAGLAWLPAGGRRVLGRLVELGDHDLVLHRRALDG